MAEAQDYIDITPQSAGGPGSAGKKMAHFQEMEINQILFNPSRLTQEGVQEKIKIWKHSNNKHVQLKYSSMLDRCKEFAKSETLPDGRLVLSRDIDDKPNWMTLAKIQTPKKSEALTNDNPKKSV